MELATHVQIQAVYVPHSANTFGKSTNPTILLLAIGEIVGQTGIFNFCMATNLR